MLVLNQCPVLELNESSYHYLGTVIRFTTKPTGLLLVDEGAARKEWIRVCLTKLG